MTNRSLIDSFQKLEATMVCGVEWVKSEDVQALIRSHTAAPDVAREVIGLLEPIKDVDWHGKWRIKKAITIMGDASTRKDEAEQPTKPTSPNYPNDISVVERITRIERWIDFWETIETGWNADRTTEPVMLEDIMLKLPPQIRMPSTKVGITKAVLDAAGVKYVE